MAFGEAPPTVVLLPMIGRPSISGTFGDKASLDPDVLMPVPVVIARGPYEAGARRGNLNHERRRRRNVNFDTVVSRSWRPHGGHASSEADGSNNAEERVVQRAIRLNQGHSHRILR
jgi:hypothetical protein